MKNSRRPVWNQPFTQHTLGKWYISFGVKYIPLNFYMLLFRTINGVVCVLCAFKPACYFYGILHTYYIGKAQRFCSVVFCCQMRFSFLKCLLYFTTLPLYNLICTFCAWFLSFYGTTYYVTISLNK